MISVKGRVKGARRGKVKARACRLISSPLIDNTVPAELIITAAARYHAARILILLSEHELLAPLIAANSVEAFTSGLIDTSARGPPGRGKLFPVA